MVIAVDPTVLEMFVLRVIYNVLSVLGVVTLQNNVVVRHITLIGSKIRSLDLLSPEMVFIRTNTCSQLNLTCIVCLLLRWSSNIAD